MTWLQSLIKIDLANPRPGIYVCVGTVLGTVNPLFVYSSDGIMRMVTKDSATVWCYVEGRDGFVVRPYVNGLAVAVKDAIGLNPREIRLGYEVQEVLRSSVKYYAPVIN